MDDPEIELPNLTDYETGRNSNRAFPQRPVDPYTNAYGGTGTHRSTAMPPVFEDRAGDNETSHLRLHLESSQGGNRTQLSSVIGGDLGTRRRDTHLGTVRETEHDHHQSKLYYNYRKASRKATFYKDADVFKQGVRLVVTQKFYRTMDVLLTDLTRRMPELSRGVRAIYTPRGADRITSVDDIQDEGKYVCAEIHSRAKGINVEAVAPPPAFHAGRAPSGRLRYATTLKFSSSADERKRQADEQLRQSMFARDSSPNAARMASSNQSDGTVGIATVAALQPYRSPYGLFALGIARKRAGGGFKRVYFRKGGELFRKYSLLLNRRQPISFEALIAELSGVFSVRIRKIFTLHGQQISSMSEILHGARNYVASQFDRFRPIDAWADPQETARKQRAKARAAAQAEGHGASGDREQQQFTSRGQFRLTVKTGAAEGSGTTAGVYISVYGTRGSFGPVRLDEKLLAGENTSTAQGLFQDASIHQFDLATGSIGRPFKVRVSHDRSGGHPAWFLTDVSMQDKHTGEDFVVCSPPSKFASGGVRRFFATDRDDGETCREFAVAVAGHTPPFFLKRYRITTVTGDYWNAGTSANVFITLYGEHGDTGVRQLWRATGGQSGGKSFTRNKTDVFELEAVDLGRVRQLVVGHDGRGEGNGWYLETVTVQPLALEASDADDTNSEGRSVFYCGKWLDEGEGDGKVVRELDPLPATGPTLDQLRHNLLWDMEKWKYDHNIELQLVSLMTRKALRIRDDGKVDALAEDFEPDATFKAKCQRGSNVCTFQSAVHSGRYLCIESEGRVTSKSSNATPEMCDLRVHLGPDPTAGLDPDAIAEEPALTGPCVAHFESAVFDGQFLTCQVSGSLADARWTLGGPGKLFVPYVKGIFRNGGIVQFFTSPLQTLSITQERKLTGLGKRTKAAHFLVRKVGDGRVRLFESELVPGRFVRALPDGSCDCQGEGDPDCQWRVRVHRLDGCVTLENVKFSWPLAIRDDGEIEMNTLSPQAVSTPILGARLYPQVIRWGVSKNSSMKNVVIGADVDLGSGPPTQRTGRGGETFLTQRVPPVLPPIEPNAGIAHPRPAGGPPLPGLILVRTVVAVPHPMASSGGEGVTIEELSSTPRSSKGMPIASSRHSSLQNVAEAEVEKSGTASPAEGEKSGLASAGSGRSATAPPAAYVPEDEAPTGLSTADEAPPRVEMQKSKTIPKLALAGVGFPAPDEDDAAHEENEAEAASGGGEEQQGTQEGEATAAAPETTPHPPATPKPATGSRPASRYRAATPASSPPDSAAKLAPPADVDGEGVPQSAEAEPEEGDGQLDPYGDVSGPPPDYSEQPEPTEAQQQQEPDESGPDTIPRPPEAPADEGAADGERDVIPPTVTEEPEAEAAEAAELQRSNEQPESEPQPEAAAAEDAAGEEGDASAEEPAEGDGAEGAGDGEEQAQPANIAPEGGEYEAPPETQQAADEPAAANGEDEAEATEREGGDTYESVGPDRSGVEPTQSEEAGEENPTTGEPNAAEPETNADSDGGATGGEEVGGTDAPAGGQEAEAADAPPADDSQNEPQADGDTGAQAEEA